MAKTGGAQGSTPLRDLALVGIGGAAGTLARYLLGEIFPGDPHMVILGINLVGAMLLGMLVMMLVGEHPRLQLLLGTGLCGGFTTYSTFALGVTQVASVGMFWSAVGLALATVIGGVIATVVGVWIGARAQRSWSRSGEEGS